MTISIAMIVKNEERCLARCLSSVQNIADEIIIVDTGSTDRTVEIAQQFGANIYYFKWIGDFAAARNYSLEQCTSDFIFVLDADEYFENNDAQKLLPYLRTVLINDNVDIVSMIRRDFLVDEKENTLNHLNDAIVSRIIKRKVNPQYVGKIHENVYKADGTLLTSFCIPQNELLLLHDGYVGKRNAEKSHRNIAILEAEKSAGGVDAMYYLYMGQSNSILLRPDLAYPFWLKYIQTGHTATAFTVLPHMNAFDFSLTRESLHRNLEPIISAVKKQYPHHPTSFLLEGRWHMFYHRYEMALTAFLRAETLYHNFTNEGERSGNLMEEFYPKMYYAVASIYRNKANIPRSIVYHLKSLKLNPNATESLNDLIQMTYYDNADQVLGFLLPIFDDVDVEHLTKLVDFLRTHRPDKVFLAYFEKLYTLKPQRDMNFYHMLIAVGELETAFDIFINRFIETQERIFLNKAFFVALLMNNPTKILDVRTHETTSFSQIIELVMGEDIDEIPPETLGDCLVVLHNLFLFRADESLVQLFLSILELFGDQSLNPVALLLLEFQRYKEAESWMQKAFEALIAANKLREAGDLLFSLMQLAYKRRDYMKAGTLALELATYGSQLPILREYTFWISQEHPNKKQKKALVSLNIQLNALLNPFPTPQQDKQALVFLKETLFKRSSQGMMAYRMGLIFNRIGDIPSSEEHFLKSFELEPYIAQGLTSQGMPGYAYVYHEIEQDTITHCPLCGEEGVPHSCYNDIDYSDFDIRFHPIRVWMICKKCNHIFARNFPSKLEEISESSYDSYLAKDVSDAALVPVREIMEGIAPHMQGQDWLDIGIGKGETLLVGKDMGFSMSGVEIDVGLAEYATKELEVPVICQDFMSAPLPRQYDVVSMGDVLEHLPDPVLAIEKAKDLLKPDGVLWISTPNFESSFTKTHKDQDPMWKVCQHLNYFSEKSLRLLLSRFDLEVIAIAESKRYNGSMELTCKVAK